MNVLHSPKKVSPSNKNETLQAKLPCSSFFSFTVTGKNLADLEAWDPVQQNCHARSSDVRRIFMHTPQHNLQIGASQVSPNGMLVQGSTFILPTGMYSQNKSPPPAKRNPYASFPPNVLYVAYYIGIHLHYDPLEHAKP